MRSEHGGRRPNDVPWQPTAPLENLQARAAFLASIRAFFHARAVMEVEVPLLSHSVVTAPHLQSFACEKDYFLQTSPEYGMKRLLAAGSGSIYYLGKAFRKGEQGARHNPEFTMLEWYRVGWDYKQLAQEVSALLQHLLACAPAQVVSYQELFERHFQIVPQHATIASLQQVALARGWIKKEQVNQLGLDKDGWLDLLMTHGIEPGLGEDRPVVVFDFPVSQAALAKTRQEAGQSVAERFEFYYAGMELANGFQELTCPIEQRVRFEADLKKRNALGQAAVPVDPYLLAALQAGLPDCAGVAVGIDRLLMLALREKSITRVLSFDWNNA